MIALVVATPIMMNGVMNRGFEISKLAVAQPLAFLALGAALVAGVLGRVLQNRGAPAWACAAFALFLAVGAVSTALSDTTTAAFFGSYYRREGLLAWMAYAAAFFALLALIRDDDRAQRYLDALLLASIVPCAYAIEQRYGLDFLFIANRDLSRPNGTLGNPVFLAAYLALLVPLTAARAWQSRRDLAHLGLWVLLALLQIGTLLVTQTRGPLLGLAGALALFAACVSMQMRARKAFICGMGLFAAGLAGLAAINVFPAAARWAGEVPVVSRMVFSLDRSASSATTLASRSASTRLGIWQAGADAFAAASPANQLIGYGPESAYVHYFQHMPAAVMRTEGYWESNSFDRLHADAIDIGMNFGALGWLAYALFFCSVIYAGARALFGLVGAAPLWMFVACTFWGGAFAAAAAIQVGLPSAAVPAFTLGMGAGWFAFLLGCVWRSLSAKRVDAPLLPADRWALLAALTCSLLAFWMDAQINIPVMTTRFISFGICALILVLASGQLEEPAEEKPGSGASDRVLGMALVVAFALTATCASFLAPAYDHSAAGSWGASWPVRIAPMIGLLLVGAWASWMHARPTMAERWQMVRLWASVALLPPALYALLHYLLAVEIGSVVGFELIRALVVVSMAASVYFVLLCALWAWSPSLNRSASGADTVRPAPLGAYRLAAITVTMVAVLATAYNAWRAVAADVAAQATTWVESRSTPEFVDAMFDRAVQLMPYERTYRRQAMVRPAVLAVAEIQASRGAAATFAAVNRNLALAEERARQNMRLWPLDPWAVFSLANYLQLRAHPLLRPNDPAGGARAAGEARALFARANQMLPSQPLFLRNWAQFESEEGNVGDAADLLARMEAIIPNEIEPYRERILLAQKLRDTTEIRITLQRAKKQLTPSDYQQLESVANLQR